MQNKMLRNNYSIVIVAAYLAVVAVYALVRGDNMWFQIHDNLDSNMAYFKMLADNNAFWDSNAIVPFLGGSVHASSLSSPLKLETAAYLFFPPNVALVVNHLASVVIAVAGGALLGRDILKDRWGKFKHLVVLISFAYGIMPVFPTTEIGMASLPLLFWMLYRLYMFKDWRMFAGIFLYPTLSSFALFEIFVCGYLLLFFVIASLVKKAPVWRIPLALFAFIAGMVLFDWSTFQSFLLSGEPSIRGSMQTADVSFLHCMKDAVTVFFFSQYHSASSHLFIALPVCCIYVVYLNVRYLRSKDVKGILKDPFNWLFVWCVFNSFMYGLNEWPAFKPFIQNHLSPLSGFSFARTLWFNGFAWYFMLAIALVRFAGSMPAWRKVFATIIAGAAVVCVALTPQTYNHIQLQIANLYKESTGQATDFTYSEFYSTKLFDQIKQDIGYDHEWSVVVGMHPAIAEYNGIATLDGYLSTYPQYYKDEFSQLMAPEFQVNPTDKQYFESFGGRAYVFNSELSYAPTKEPFDGAIELRIDPSVFRAMNGTYVFSRAAITNGADLGLDFVGEYSDPSSPYRIFAYKTAAQE